MMMVIRHEDHHLRALTDVNPRYDLFNPLTPHHYKILPPRNLTISYDARSLPRCQHPLYILLISRALKTALHILCTTTLSSFTDTFH